MSRKAIVSNLAVAAALIGSIAACASFRVEGSTPAVWPPAVGVRKDLRLSVQMDTSLDGKPVALSPWQMEKVVEHTRRIYDESRLFTAIAAEPGEASADDALRANVRIRHTVTPIFGWTPLTYVTLFVIPNVQETRLESTTTFSTAQGQVLATIEEKQRIVTYEQIVFLPISFFTFPIPVYWWAVDDLNRSTLADADSRGIL